jgi:hypothetical protein
MRWREEPLGSSNALRRGILVNISIRDHFTYVINEEEERHPIF